MAKKFDLNTAMQSPLTVSTRSPRTVPTLLTKEANQIITNMANTTFSTTSIKHLAGLIGTAPAVTPNLNLFAQVQEITTDPEQSSEIPIVSDIGDVQTAAPYDYEASDVVIDNIAESPTKFALPFSVLTADQQAAGLTVRQLVNSAVSKFEASIWDTIIAPLFDETNFGVATGTAAAAFNAGDFEALLASVVGRDRAVVLDTDYAMKVKTDWIPAAGTTHIVECNRWLTAGSDVKGLVAADRRGLIVQTGLPLVTRTQALRSAREIVALPGLNIPTELTVWHNNSTKADHACLTSYVSAAVADASALRLLKISVG